MGRIEILERNFGIAPVESVEEPGAFTLLVRTDNCHTNIFTNGEYQTVIAAT
jgi:hypothetical protein